MTSLLERPETRPVVAPSRRQLAARGALSTMSILAVVGAVTLVLVLVVWAAADRSSASAATASRVALALVLLTCRAPLHVAGGTVAMPPLGLTLLVFAAVWRSASTLFEWWVEECGVDDFLVAPPRIGLEVVAAISLPFAVIVTVMAWLLNGPGLQPSVGGALLGSMILSMVAATVGVGRRGGVAAVCELLPDAVRDGVSGAASAAGVIVTGGTICVIAALGWHAGHVARLAGHAGGGVVGDIALGALSLVLIPNAALIAVSYLAGGNVAVGTGTSVTTGAVHLGSMPAVPLLAAVPHGPAPIVVRVGLWGIVAAAAIAAGLLPRGRSTAMRESLVRAGVASVGCAVLLGMLVAISGGPAGPHGLALIGGSGWKTSLLLLAELGCGSVAVVSLRGFWGVLLEIRGGLRADA